MANGHGGARPGAGKPRGSKHQKTQEQLDAVAEGGITPLGYLLSVMRDEVAERSVRIDAAKAAAPYVHTRLIAQKTELTGLEGGAIQVSHVEVVLVDPSEQTDTDRESI